MFFCRVIAKLGTLDGRFSAHSKMCKPLNTVRVSRSGKATQWRSSTTGESRRRAAMTKFLSCTDSSINLDSDRNGVSCNKLNPKIGCSPLISKGRLPASNT